MWMFSTVYLFIFRSRIIVLFLKLNNQYSNLLNIVTKSRVVMYPPKFKDSTEYHKQPSFCTAEFLIQDTTEDSSIVWFCTNQDIIGICTMLVMFWEGFFWFVSFVGFLARSKDWPCSHLSDKIVYSLFITSITASRTKFLTWTALKNRGCVTHA